MLPGPLLWVITGLIALITNGGLKGLLPQLVGKDPINPNDVTLQRYAPAQPTVLITKDPTTGQEVAVPVTPSTVQVDPPKPPPSSVAKDLVNTPWSMWGLAAVGFVGVFVVAQLRAAAHEASTGVKTVYNEAKATTANLKKGGDTSNQSRYSKGGDA